MNNRIKGYVYKTSNNSQLIIPGKLLNLDDGMFLYGDQIEIEGEDLFLDDAGHKFITTDGHEIPVSNEKVAPKHLRIAKVFFDLKPAEFNVLARAWNEKQMPDIKTDVDLYRMVNEAKRYETGGRNPVDAMERAIEKTVPVRTYNPSNPSNVTPEAKETSDGPSNAKEGASGSSSATERKSDPNRFLWEPGELIRVNSDKDAEEWRKNHQAQEESETQTEDPDNVKKLTSNPQNTSKQESSEEESEDVPESDMDMEASDRAFSSPKVQAAIARSNLSLGSETASDSSTDKWVTIEGRRVNLGNKEAGGAEVQSSSHFTSLLNHSLNTTQPTTFGNRENLTLKPPPLAGSSESSRGPIRILSRNAEEAEKFIEHYNLKVSPEEIAMACGARDYSHISFRCYGGSRRKELRLNIMDPYFSGSRNIYKVNETDPDFILHNLNFKKSYTAPEGQGAYMLERELQMARKLGVSKIICHAAGFYGHPDYTGYYVWPRCGYDRALSTMEKYKANNRGFTDANTVLGLMATEAGRTYWKLHGSAGDMAFDPSPGSASSEILKAYLSEIRSKSLGKENV